MKRSKLPTEYIAIKADTKSDWDQCNLAILNITPEWLKIIDDRIKLLDAVKKDLSFYSMVYWDAPDGYFVLPKQELEEIFEQRNSWEYITLKDGELDVLSIPESQLDTDMMFMNVAGQVHFMCYGKHTGEEYSTECIDMKAVLNHYTNIFNRLI